MRQHVVILGVVTIIAAFLLFTIILNIMRKQKSHPVIPPPPPADEPKLNPKPLSQPQYSYLEQRKWPSTHTVLAIVSVDVEIPELNCIAFKETIDNVQRSSWRENKILFVKPLVQTNYWHDCVSQWNSLIEDKIIWFSHSQPSTAMAITQALTQEHSDFFVLLQVGDTIDATYFEKAILSMYTYEKYVGYVSSYWSIGDSKVFTFTHSTNNDASCILAFYGTSPAAFFRTDAVLNVDGFITALDQLGCHDWELKWRLHIAGWAAYTIHEDLYTKNYYNIHSSSLENKILRCTYQKDSEAFLKYLNTNYKLYSIPNLPDLNTMYSYKRQRITIPWDPVKVSSRPGRPDKSRKGLLVIIPWLIVGGAETFALNVIQTFSKMNWDVTVVITKDAAPYGGNVWVPVAKKDTLDVFELPTITHRSQYFQYICHLIRSRGINSILMTNNIAGYAALPFISNYCPVGATLDVNHNWVDSWMDGGYTTFSLDFQEYIDYQVQISNQLAQKMIKEGAKERKVETIFIGTNTTFFTNQLHKYESRTKCLREFAPELFPEEDTKKKVIVYLGRLSGEKQPDVFIDTMIELKKQGYESQVAGILAGHGYLQGTLKDKIPTSNAQDIVKMVGVLDAERKRKLLSCSDILLMTSQTEGTPLVIFEAMSLRSIIVAPSVGGIPEMVPPSCGILIDNQCSKTEQIKRYVTAIKKILDLSPEEQEEMKKASETMARKKYDITSMAAKLERLMIQAQQDNELRGWTRVDTWKRWPTRNTAFSAAVGLLRVMSTKEEW